MKAPKVKDSDAESARMRIGGNPEILLVPPELEQVADQIFQNSNFGGGTTVANANIYARKYRPVVVPWLSDTEFTGFSTTAWYLMRSPAAMAAMVVSFLNGQRTPTVESTDASFDTLGVVFRGYHDFGVDQAEYLSGVKSKGAA
jgi:phage major head subunit gpT-like protein